MALEQNILKTLTYFDILEHPLTLPELQRYLLKTEDEIAKPSFSELQQSLVGLENAGKVNSSDGFYFLAGRSGLVNKRLVSYNYYFKRLFRAHKLIRFLKYVPYLRAIILSGSLAGMHTGPQSDIDFVIIVKPGRIWLARLFLTGWTQALGVRRYSNKITNRVCLSHYVAADKSFEVKYRPLDYANMLPLLNAPLASELLQRETWLSDQLVSHPEMPLSVVSQKPSRIIQPLFEIISEVLGAAVWNKVAEI
ncbi:MAG TPA: hypothetical protein VEA37_00030, partial [Flavobacterium sp.]|nr:hypothetical protein [Flavobacterium sp.]